MQGIELVEKLVEWAASRKAENIKFYDLRGKTSYTDYVVIVEGSSELHLNAIAENIVDECKENKIHVRGKEGMKSSSWVLLDFVDVIVHILTPTTREFYKLDDLFTKLQDNQKPTDQDEDINA
ncbi:ribosome silencing factor [bacterium]|nr:ribosome silencing factor [bacterium]